MRFSRAFKSQHNVLLTFTFLSAVKFEGSCKANKKLHMLKQFTSNNGLLVLLEAMFSSDVMAQYGKSNLFCGYRYR